MAYIKINPTGCAERKGLVQVRFDCYFEPTDPGYAEYHVTVPVVPVEGYPGKVDKMGSPVDIADYDKWLAARPQGTRPHFSEGVDRC